MSTKEKTIEKTKCQNDGNNNKEASHHKIQYNKQFKNQIIYFRIDIYNTQVLIFKAKLSLGLRSR